MSSKQPASSKRPTIIDGQHRISKFREVLGIRKKAAPKNRKKGGAK